MLMNFERFKLNILRFLDADYEPIRKKTKANEKIVVNEEETPAEQNREPYLGQFSRMIFQFSNIIFNVDYENILKQQR